MVLRFRASLDRRPSIEVIRLVVFDAIELISHDRMPALGEMHADLVLSSGFRKALHQTEFLASCKDMKARMSAPAAFFFGENADLESDLGAMVLAERKRNLEVVLFRNAVNDGEIFLLRNALFELG